MDALIQTIPGANAFVSWFGQWPSFHDAEVLRITLDRKNASLIEIHVFKMTNEVDSKGQYVCVNHAKLRLVLLEITSCELLGFNHQNVIDDLDITRIEDGYQTRLFSIYGVDGTVDAKFIVIEFEPGIPEGSVYLS
jgi:hypothetical protein